jgi:hypothetical protein
LQQPRHGGPVLIVQTMFERSSGSTT